MNIHGEEIEIGDLVEYWPGKSVIGAGIKGRVVSIGKCSVLVEINTDPKSYYWEAVPSFVRFNVGKKIKKWVKNVIKVSA